MALNRCTASRELEGFSDRSPVQRGGKGSGEGTSLRLKVDVTGWFKQSSKQFFRILLTIREDCHEISRDILQ
jgi:hypothetical protein